MGWAAVHAADGASGRVAGRMAELGRAGRVTARVYLRKYHGPLGPLGRTWPTGTMAFWTVVMLGAYLMVFLAQ
jgi:hypothetical protein